MPVKLKNEQAALEAIDRLVIGKPIRSKDALLLDRNLVTESGITKPTLYRCIKAMAKWRKAKEDAVLASISNFAQLQQTQPLLSFSDADLLAAARIDHAALYRMPEELLRSWENVKNHSPQRSRQQRVRDNPDVVIASLISKLYALTLAIKRRDAIIETQVRELERLGSNVVSLQKN